jgi:polyferredoxin
VPSLPAATWVRPPANAKLHKYRRALQIATSLIFILAPFVGLFRIDVRAGVLVLAGADFGLGDLYAVYLLIVVFVLAVFAGALLYGRVYCGWMCPQTTLSEWVASVERWACKKLGRERKEMCRAVQTVITLLISAFVSASLVSYFLSPSDWLRPPRAAWIGFGFTLPVLVGFLAMRHRFCIAFCPYGIMQNLIQDRRTLGVELVPERKDECTNCLLCVRACFMGIDIRKQAFDTSCLNCGDCIAATSIAKTCPDEPLIRFRYGTQPSTWPAWLRKSGISDARRAVVVAATVIVTVIFALSLAGRRPLEAEIAVDYTNASWTETGVKNTYRLTARSREKQPLPVRLELSGPAGLVLSTESLEFVHGEHIHQFEITAPPDAVAPGAHDVKVRVVPSRGEALELPTLFFVPSRRSSCAGSSSPSSSPSALSSPRPG